MTKIVGIAGTAKNTGKTSVVSNLLIKGKENNIKIGLTSIGYDGESTDNITGLPKPRLIVSNGTIVAIAEKCLTNTTAELKIIKKTNFVTPLGRVVIGIIKKEGLVVLAGPNKTRDLKAVISQMKELGSELIIVDGALNRLAPMSVVENIVLATGAAKNRDLNQLAIETLCLLQIFELSDKCTMSDSKEGSYNGILLNTINNKSIVLNTTSLVNETALNKIINYINTYNIHKIFIPGIISIDMLDELLSRVNTNLNKIKLIFGDPIKLAISHNNPLIINETLKKAKKYCAHVGVAKNIPITAITINPFYPHYKHGKCTYVPNYVNEQELQTIMVKHISSVPVINVLKEKDMLFQLL